MRRSAVLPNLEEKLSKMAAWLGLDRVHGV